jgi:phosphohistidine phosphatase SixA
VNARTETQLCLLRHAHAGDPMKWTGDDEVRPLTDKGRQQSERLGRFLAMGRFKPDAILTSPRTRAAETARLVAAELGVRVDIVDELGGPLDLAAVDRILAATGNPIRPVLVGHDPDFSMLAAELAGLSELPLRKGTLVRIDAPRPFRPGAGALRWLVPPDLLGSEG